MISIIIPYLLKSECIDLCLEKIKANTTCSYEVVTIKDSNNVYGAYNYGAMKSHGDIITFLNDDMVVAPAWNESIEKHCTPRTIVTTRLIEPGYLKPNKTITEKDFGRHPDDFDYQAFIKFVSEQTHEECVEPAFGWFMPFGVQKDSFVAFPNQIPFPHNNDFGLFQQLSVMRYKFKLVNSYAYHFQRMSQRDTCEEVENKVIKPRTESYAP